MGMALVVPKLRWQGNSPALRAHLTLGKQQSRVYVRAELFLNSLWGQQLSPALAPGITLQEETERLRI